VGQVSRETAKFAQRPQGPQAAEGAVFHMKRVRQYRRLPTCGYGGGVMPQVENLRYGGGGDTVAQVGNLRRRAAALQ